MIKVEKDFTNIPKILKSSNRKEAFEKSIFEGKYNDSKNLYKVGSVQKKLNEIYALKCAYCEKRLLDSPKHIEHYRPKKIYYWLAYSWDNLLLSCGECNSAKGDRFTLDSDQVNYDGEAFENIHLLGEYYDRLEKPKIIHPEKEDILELIVFDKKGLIHSTNRRVKYTIESCNLNRESLTQLREEVLVNFIETMEGHYFYYQKSGDVTRFIPTVQTFLEECRFDNQFYALRAYFIQHSELFIEDKILAKLTKKIIDKLL